jgi:uncharacterized protein
MSTPKTSIINWRKIQLFLLISFGFSWLTALIMNVCHVDFNTTSATLIIAIFYMFGPAIATIVVQKYLYKEKLSKIGLNFDKSKIKGYFWILVVFLLLLSICFVVILIFGNLFHFSQFGVIDFSQENFNEALLNLIQSKSNLTLTKIPELPVVTMFIVFIIQGLISGFTINIPIMFGEEFGWRGFLLNETKSLGFFKSSLFIGIFWGLWHLPLILIGLNYPNYPILGIFIMCLFTISLSPVFSYLRIKLNSILAPCILHGSINATGTIFILYTKDGNELFSSIAGFAGILAGLLTSFLLFFILDKRFLNEYKNF